MIELIHNFHFLRPWWLLAMLPAAAMWWVIFRRDDSKHLWQQWVEPVLLDALMRKGGKRQRLRPIHVLGLFWIVTVLALAGPTWQRTPSPFAEDKAALVIVLKVTPSMEETDIAPSRLQRAAQKISDLLAARPGTRNALIAYAGSAHLVMPLTTDANVINTFAADLSPTLMPKEGDDAAAALRLSERQLDKGGQPGAVLFITDELNEEAVARFCCPSRERRGNDSCVGGNDRRTNNTKTGRRIRGWFVCGHHAGPIRCRSSGSRRSANSDIQNRWTRGRMARCGVLAAAVAAYNGLVLVSPRMGGGL